MTTLTFQTTTLSVINQQNQIWLSALDIGKALGYSNGDIGVKNIYNRHQDEFTPNMTALVDMQTAGGMQKVRIFSLRGCHLIGMLSHTKLAKDFRHWVLDILDKEVSQNQQQNLPLAETEKTYDTNTTAKEIHELVWLLFSHEQMRSLLEHLYKPLEAIGSRYSGAIYGNYTEYKRHYDKCLPILKRFVEQIKADNPKAWEGLQYRLTAK